MNKFYAYLLLRTGEKGICNSWAECDLKVKGKEARYRGFKTRQEAETWLRAGADYAIKRVKKMKPGIYFDAGTGRGEGVEISVTDEKGENLLHKVLHKRKISAHGKHKLGYDVTNNFGELSAMKYALELALKQKVKHVFGDSKLVIDFWSKWHVKKDLLKETFELSRKVSALRDKFEKSGGEVKRVSGDDNPADLGFH